MKKRDYKKEFSTLIDKFAYRYSRWQVWNDFLSLSALSLANVMPGPENGEREEQYCCYPFVPTYNYSGCLSQD